MSAQTRFAVRAHRCILHWLETDGMWLSADEHQAVNAGLNQRLLKLADKLRWQRQWRELNDLRRFLQSYTDDPQVAAYLRRRDWPQWMYWLNDQLRRKKAAA